VRADALSLARWSAERGLRRTELEALHRVLVAGHLQGTSDPTDDDELVAIAARDLSARGLWLPSVRPSARLTAREREIAGLAAGGLSSRAIAERLTLSVRTVDSHLSRVFTKLNVRDRQELRGVRDSLSPAAT